MLIASSLEKGSSSRISGEVTATTGPSTGKIVTSVPRHPGDLNRNLLKKIPKQVGWTEEQFRKLL